MQTHPGDRYFYSDADKSEYLFFSEFVDALHPAMQQWIFKIPDTYSNLWLQDFWKDVYDNDPGELEFDMGYETYRSRDVILKELSLPTCISQAYVNTITSLMRTALSVISADNKFVYGIEDAFTSKCPLIAPRSLVGALPTFKPYSECEYVPLATYNDPVFTGSMYLGPNSAVDFRRGYRGAILKYDPYNRNKRKLIWVHVTN